MSAKLKVYLAGTTSYNAMKYRSDAKNYFNNILDLFDPLFEVESYITNFKKGHPWQLNNDEVERIVVGDKEAIKTCHILVAYIEKFTCGTTMEILHAWNNNIPIYVINPEQNYIHDIWLRYHTSKFFTTINECFKFIVKEVNK